MDVALRLELLVEAFKIVINNSKARGAPVALLLHNFLLLVFPYI